MSNTGDSGKSYHHQCTGLALKTANEHQVDTEITFFAACFCPFVQRVWVAFEFLGIPYKYYEVDPYAKPQELLEISPKGLVPGLRLKDGGKPRALNESTVILEYLEDIASQTTGRSLLPPSSDPYVRALVRLQCDHVSRALLPAFYRYLQAQDADAQIAGGKEFVEAIDGLIRLLERQERETPQYRTGQGEGLWREGGEINLLDVVAGPWLFRATNVLTHYRGFDVPSGPKFNAWTQRLFEHPAFKATRSDEQLYLDSYERYAYNRPNTSQVVNAINAGLALP
ncbi:thioredoxin-like protein [Vararia minispora EC-137]|uniref:Thioredoxin-like protein n=1 Tax=Vararia minispora EC-137 TaxID=1314806 RepID=A0ACB8QZ03_9AGAM|nr:thioredoxin-like protein [Vararia minispora EC-137]